MSPKTVIYKSNSIIYFKEDINNDKIYLLNEGKVVLNYLNIETGQDIHELIKTGEFFGVRSAFGRYPREETAMVTQDSKVIVFSVPEFEQFVSSNSRIILKMLKVFSNQLRRIHKQVQNLLNAENQTNPEIGLFNIGEYYLNAKKYNQALYALKRYLVYYPSGEFSKKVTGYIKMAQEYVTKYGEGGGPPVTTAKPTETAVQKPQQTKVMSPIAQKFYNAVTLIGQADYSGALKALNAITQQSEDEEYKLKALFETGKCYFNLKQYGSCIKCYMSLVQNYPKHPDMKEALYYIGQCYEKKGDKPKALEIYRRVLKMTAESEQLCSNVHRSIRNLEKG
ncbi:MAG: tetratricopeptide repeat protein [Spirochaetales bacterium]|nr:tetratricopeptide repeat protein [Spirochaetales bacterium]